MLTKKDVYKKIEEHYLENYERLLNTAMKRTGSKHKAEDVVQDTYLRACEYWQSCKEDRDFDKWIEAILFNCLRAQFKDDIMKGMSDDRAAQEDTLEPPQEHKVMLDEVRERINNHPNGYVLHLYLIDGFRDFEIAKVVPYGMRTIQDIVYKFRKDIRDEYGKAAI